MSTFDDIALKGMSQNTFDDKSILVQVKFWCRQTTNLYLGHCWPRSKSSCGIALAHWGRVTHICVSKLTIIGSDNGLSPSRCQAIIWTNAAILVIGPMGTNFSEILIEFYAFSFLKMRLQLSSVKWRPFCLGLNVLMHCRLGLFTLCFTLHHLCNKMQKTTH